MPQICPSLTPKVTLANGYACIQHINGTMQWTPSESPCCASIIGCEKGNCTLTCEINWSIKRGFYVTHPFSVFGSEPQNCIHAFISHLLEGGNMRVTGNGVSLHARSKVIKFNYDTLISALPKYVSIEGQTVKRITKVQVQKKDTSAATGLHAIY